MKNTSKSKKYRLFISLIFIFSLLVFYYLYSHYLILTDYIEHGVITKKTDLGSSFKYEIYVDGKPISLTTKGKLIDLNEEAVVNLKHRKSIIVKFIGYVEPLKEKIMSKTQSIFELEYSGFIDISGELSAYKQSNKDFSRVGLNSIIVGAENISIYKDNRGHIRTLIQHGDTVLDFMRVGIKNQGFQSLAHDKIEFVSGGGLKVVDKQNEKIIDVPPKAALTLIASKKGITVTSPAGQLLIENRAYVYPADDNALISILSFKRGYGIPSYRGFFEITASSGALKLINEVKLDNYLYQVVPSEMPSSFGLEALKAQAVAARTYAVSDLLSGRYAAEGFHVDDSTMSQVYNNIQENSYATRAVEETSGLVMKYKDQLVEAMYYSTSHGYGANAEEIWSSDGNFPGTKKPYLSAISYILDGSQYNLSSEEDAHKFFKDWSLKSYDSHSPYFRWRTVFTGEELKNTIEKNLPIIYERQKNYILTLHNGEFESKKIDEHSIGTLVDMRVTKRGEGGNIMELVIEGTGGTYKIVKELNVRYVLRPRKSDTGSDRDILIKRIKGSDLSNASLLPSAFMVFDINKKDDGSIIDVTFHGGGYGHSVGMSQYGAGYLSSKGYTFDSILKTYYRGITIEKL